jgi:hypothetical protein
MQMNTDQSAEIVESLPETPKAKKPRKVAGKKTGEKPGVVAETPPKKPARKPVKPKAKKLAKPEPKMLASAKAEKPSRRKPGPKKKVAEKPIKAAAVAKKKPGRKPGRKPGKKAAALVPVARGKKLTARRTDVIKKGQQALEFFLDQQRQIDEMALALANYERVFEAVRRLFGREMDEIEELVVGLLE